MMKKTFVLLAMLLAVVAQAAPPYDVTVTFTPPITGGAPDGYNFYVDDCAVTGPIGLPVLPAYDPLISGSGTFSGKQYIALIPADGTYEMCVRAINAAGENPDPGQVATVVINDLPLPGPINSLGIQVTCPLSNCTINITVN